jgi:hypothetical protein
MKPKFAFVSIAGLLLLMSGCAENEFPGNDRAAEEVAPKPAADVAPAEDAVRQADLASTYPHTMSAKEYGKVVGGRTCRFSYTSVGDPVLVMASAGDDSAPAPAVMKLNGKLFELKAKSDGKGGVARAGGVMAAVTPDDDHATNGGPREAEFVFRIEGAEEVGYWGYYTCD